jgi:DNA polymerase-1
MYNVRTMHQKVHIIEDSSQLDKAFPLINSSKILSIDTETEGLNPLNSELRLLQASNNDDTLVIDVKKIGKERVGEVFRPILESKDVVKVFHNAKFDTKFIKHHLKSDVERLFDSYLGSLLIEAGLSKPKGFHGLEETLRRYTGIEISKDEQVSDWSGSLSANQFQYAAKDAQVLLPLRDTMIEKLRELALFRVAELEFNAVLPVAWMELCGFYLDYKQWIENSQKNLKDAHFLEYELLQELAPFVEQGSLFGVPNINFDSPQQVYKYFSAYGVPMPFDNQGNPSTKEPFLQPLVEEYPIIGKLLDYRGKSKASSSFGENWKEFINPITGRVHSDFIQIGPETGRFASRNPNLQNVPKENEFRNCFKAEKGNTLVSGDYSQIELRILADLSNDSYALECFEQDLDFHLAMASKIGKVPLEEAKPFRNVAKNVNFAIPYGAGTNRVAATAKVPYTDAEKILKAYFDGVPNIKRWLNTQKWAVLKTKSSRTVSGRLVKYDFADDDYVSRGKAQRNATNSPIQGSSADILKRALRIFYDRTKDIQDKIKLVNIVHDEMNVETPTSMKKEVSKILQSSMEDAGKEFLNKVKVTVDISTSRVWQKG